MMRRLLAISLTGLLTMGFLVILSATPTMGADKVFKWRMQSNLNPGEPGYESVKSHFCEVAEKLSGGRLKIQLFPVGSLFPIKEGLEAISMGLVEIGMATGGYYVGKLGPIATIESGLPGAERNAVERYNFFYKRGFLDIARKAYGKHDVFYLAPHLSPQWDLMSKRPLRGIKDFKGLKVRAYGIEADWFKSMGASPVFIGGAELYTSLATGVVDAARWGSPAVNKSTSLYEVAKYYIQPSSLPAPNNFFGVNPRAWKSLPDDLKAILEQAAISTSLDYMGRGALEDAKATAFMQSKGVEFIRIPDEEWSEMEKLARGFWNKYAEKDPEFCGPAVKILNDYLTDLGR